MYSESAQVSGAPADAPPSGAADVPAGDLHAAPAALVPALQHRGFERLTAVQRAVIAADDGKSDLRIASQTGSGKTVALGFALAAAVGDPARKGPTTIVVAPTRELAAQVKDELAWLFADLPLATCDSVTGGTSVLRERQRLKRRPAVLVATPGRLLDHLREGVLDASSVRQLVLDEADQMLDLGFKDELDGILACLPAERRTHLVSATFPREVVELADRFQREPVLVEGSDPGGAHVDIEHVVHRIAPRGHYEALVTLLRIAGDERTLVFVRTREDTATLADKLAADGLAALPLSGDLAQAQRTRTLAAFKNGSVRTLVATDVAARGIDVAAVTSVVHVDLPIDAATYVHRSGRTGRAGQKGRSVLFVTRSGEAKARRLCREAGIEAELLPLPGPEDVEASRLRRAEDAARLVVEQAIGNGVAEASLAAAARLLEGRDPAVVVAALLGGGATEPRASGKPAVVEGKRALARATQRVENAAAEAPVRAAQAGEARADGGKTTAVAASADAAVAENVADDGQPTDARERDDGRTRLPAKLRGRPGAPPSWRRSGEHDAAGRATSRPAAAGFVRFSINWGLRQGAEPGRILAHVCRRGGVDSGSIGGIELGPTSSTFEVARDVATTFARRVRAPDRRDPHLVVTPAGAAAPRPFGRDDRDHRDGGGGRDGRDSHGARHAGGPRGARAPGTTRGARPPRRAESHG